MPECQKCGIDRPWIHKHHIKPRSQGGTDDPTNILRVCANCHEDIHGGPAGGSLRGGLANTPEARAKKSRSLKRFYEDPEHRAQVSEVRRRTHAQDPTIRVRQAETYRKWIAEHPEEWAERSRKISESKRAKAAEAPDVVAASHAKTGAAQRGTKRGPFPRDADGHAYNPKTGKRIGRPPKK